MLHIQGFLSIVSALPEAIGRISSKNTKGIHHTAEKWPRPFPDQELFAIPRTCSFTFTIGCIFPLVRRHGTCEHDRTLTLVLWTLRYVLLNMSISPVAAHYISLTISYVAELILVSLRPVVGMTSGLHNVTAGTRSSHQFETYDMRYVAAVDLQSRSKLTGRSVRKVNHFGAPRGSLGHKKFRFDRIPPTATRKHFHVKKSPELHHRIRHVQCLVPRSFRS